jgi:predicted lipoprotein with Yx(FWY)xxD motif
MRLGWSVAGLAAVALVAAACTGGGASSSGAGTYGAGPAPSSGAAMAAVVTAGNSTCQGACASAWPPYLSNGATRPGNGVSGALVGSSPRDDGATQVTYHSHPLYYYAGDSRPGDAVGQGLNQFGAKWYVVAASGDKIDTD